MLYTVELRRENWMIKHLRLTFQKDDRVVFRLGFSGTLQDVDVWVVAYHFVQGTSNSYIAYELDKEKGEWTTLFFFFGLFDFFFFDAPPDSFLEFCRAFSRSWMVGCQADMLCVFVKGQQNFFVVGQVQSR